MPSAGASAIITTNTNRREVEPLQASAVGPVRAAVPTGRSPHDALDALATGITRKRVNWVLDADFRDYFSSLDHQWLERFVEHRIADGRVLRLIRKWLRAGVIEEGSWTAWEEGVSQGASASPLLANIYLHVCPQRRREAM